MGKQPLGGKKISRVELEREELPKPHHAKLRGELNPRGTLRMARGLTEQELKALTEAPRGPGVDPVIEDFAEYSVGRSLRWVNSGEHPLTLAYHQGRITFEQFCAGEHLRTLCERLNSSGRDSTDLERVRGGGQQTPWSRAQAESAQEIGRIKQRLSRADYTICRKFCGEGYTMVEAVRAARIRFDKNRVTARVCDALDALAGKPKKRSAGRKKQGRTKPRRLTDSAEKL